MNSRPEKRDRRLFTLQDVPKYECIKAFVSRFPGTDPAAVESCLWLLRVSSELFEAFEEHFSRHNVSRGRFSVLMLLHRYAGEQMTCAELAKRAGVTRPTMTGLLDGLQEVGLVQRHSHPDDRRSFTVSLTERGREFLDNMLPEHFRRVGGLMSQLNEEERKMLVTLLQKVETGLGALRTP